MSASYPGSAKAFTTKNNGDTINAAHIDDLQDEVTALETGLLAGLAHNLLPDTDVARALGTSAKRFLHPAGSAPAPGVAVSETDCGIYSSGANAIDFATNGTKALGIDSTQFIDSPTQPRCRVYNTATQSIPDTTATAITWNTETYDIGAMHDPATNPSRLTIPTGGDGLYLIIGNYSFNANATGYRFAVIRKGGVTTIGSALYTAVSATNAAIIQVTAVANLVATDYVELVASQTSGGPLTSGSTADDFAWFSIVKLW